MPVEGEDDTVAGSLPTLSGGELLDNTLVAKRYRIVRWLGGGGMGRVYEALDTELGERVALKMLRGGLTDDALERFRREVKLTRRIQHKNVARMFDIGDHGEEKFLTMELVEGTSLAREIGKPMPWRRLRAFAIQICDGLAAAHAAGIVHRDLKPDNILVERGTERVVITDFGIARGGVDDPVVTRVGAVVGTPRYMAPEQLAGDDVDARADLFALGVMLFELATGSRPWQGDNAITIAVAQATQPPRQIDPITSQTPAEFAGIVASCLQIERDRRPASATEIASALAAHEPVAGSTGATRALRPGRPSQSSFAPTPTNTNAAAPSIIHEPTSLAVLPPTCAPGDEYLADGLLDDLVDTLSTTAGIRVRPAGVVRSVQAIDPRELGRQLHVDHVLSASIRRAPDRLRVTARMISVVDGFQIWAHRLDCSEAEILAASTTLARGCAEALSTRATGAITRPTDPRAVDLFLRARAEMRRFWAPHIVAAADLLQNAVEYAPNSPEILGAFAFASVQAWVMRDTPDAHARAVANLDRGLAAGHGEAFLASAQYAFNTGEFERGAHDLGTALVRAPMLGQAHELAGRILVEVEGTATARHHFETAIALAPNRASVIAADLARIDVLEDDWASAERRIAALVADPDPSIAQLGFILTMRLLNGWRGRSSEFESLGERIPKRVGDSSLQLREFIRLAAASGDLEAERWREFLGPRAENSPLRPRLLALQLLTELSLVFGRRAIALDALGHAADVGLMDITWLHACPLFVDVRDDHRFEELRDKVSARAARVLAAFRSVAPGV